MDSKPIRKQTYSSPSLRRSPSPSRRSSRRRSPSYLRRSPSPSRRSCRRRSPSKSRYSPRSRRSQSYSRRGSRHFRSREERSARSSRSGSWTDGTPNGMPDDDRKQTYSSPSLRRSPSPSRRSSRRRSPSYLRRSPSPSRRSCRRRSPSKSRYSPRSRRSQSYSRRGSRRSRSREERSARSSRSGSWTDSTPNGMPDDDQEWVTVPPFYTRFWPTPPLPKDESTIISQNPRFVLTVKCLYSKLKQHVESAQLDEIHKPHLAHLVQERVRRRIKEMLKNVHKYLTYKEIKQIYLYHFNEATNPNLVDEIVLHIKEKLIKNEMSLIDVDDPEESQIRNKFNELDDDFLNRRVKEEIEMLKASAPLVTQGVSPGDLIPDDQEIPHIDIKVNLGVLPIRIKTEPNVENDADEAGLPVRIKQEPVEKDKETEVAESRPAIVLLPDFKKEAPPALADEPASMTPPLRSPVLPRAKPEPAEPEAAEPVAGEPAAKPPTVSESGDDVKDPNIKEETIDLIQAYLNLINEVHVISDSD